MDRNTITGLIIIFAILIGYSIWMTPSQEEKEAAKHRQDSVMKVQRTQDSIAIALQINRQKQDSINRSAEAQAAENNAETMEIQSTVNRDKMGAFANSSVGSDTIYFIENEYLEIGISAKGGKIISVRLKDFQTFDSLPLNLFNPEKTNFGLTFFASNRLINTNELYFKPGAEERLTVTGDQTASFSMKLFTD